MGACWTSSGFGPFTVSGSPLPAGGVGVACGPRRVVLDKILLDAAGAAGAEVRENFSVQDVLVENGRVTGIRGHASGTGSPAADEHAGLVVGADARHSLVARAVQAAAYHERQPLSVGCYAYWSGPPVSGFDTHLRPGRVVAGMPAHDELNCLVVAAPVRRWMRAAGLRSGRRHAPMPEPASPAVRVTDGLRTRC